MVDFFLKIDSVPGDSHDSRHPDEIEVMAFSWGESQAVSVMGSGAGAGKVSMEEFHFTTLIGTASPKLMVLCANGKHVKNAILSCRRTGVAQPDYLKITLSDVTVSAYHVSASTGDGPVDEVSLRFGKVQIDFKPQKANGALGAAVHAGWDVKLNKEA